MMEDVGVLWASLTLTELLKGLAISIVLSRFLSPRYISQHKNESKSTTKSIIAIETLKITGFFLLFLFARSWLALVDKYVPEPYLDEVFHIPQAQVYCEGRYWEWDDKITTPPGLYLLSVAYHKFWRLASCTPFTLRSNNLLVLLLTALLAALCRGRIETRMVERDDTSGKPKSPSYLSFYSYHTALNIALFPVIFFFSGLYYTDVASTLVVLVAYYNHLGRVGTKQPGVVNDIWTVILGVVAIFMRQTNVFWVVVYMGGLEAVHAVRGLKPAPLEMKVSITTLSEQVMFSVKRWSLGDIEDVPLDVSFPHDWVFCLLSIAVAAICNPLRVLRQLWPQITILGLFAVFVAWNGGVVLGDKSNHVATIHLAQMLYIWPFFAFFSAPLLLPTVLDFIAHPRLTIITSVGAKFKSAEQKPCPPTAPQEYSLPLRLSHKLVSHGYYLVPYLLFTEALSWAIIKYNTIIHPFTLADNRHYMFYIFRYTIRRSLRWRYNLRTAYLVSRYLVWRRLAGDDRRDVYPDVPPSVHTAATATNENKTESKPPPITTDGAKLTATTTDIFLLPTLGSPSSSPSTRPPQTSTVLLWLLTTALSLVTAPLVEPRYFILPWVFFRLLVPAWQAKPTPAAKAADNTRLTKLMRPVYDGLVKLGGRRVDLSLVLETVWFVGINLGTMYVFLYWPFVWRNKETRELLDGGKLQRFMW